ncbi:MAG: hypothetical protein RDV48_19220 [Candidatus Eremiobacteraeota bacterium]|nr:hypothetical protein [Candidatus Eremiobacteraeota bacterium]
MRLAVIFHRNPDSPLSRIDIIRLRALTTGFYEKGIETDIIAPLEKETLLFGGTVRAKPLGALEGGRYDIVKTCYHPSIRYALAIDVPVVARIVRVVDEKLPERDEGGRAELLECQELIAEKAAHLVLNNRENELRWRERYGEMLPVTLIPTGCPPELPPPGKSPYPPDEKVILFAGSICAPRMAELLNEAADLLPGGTAIHFVGENKSAMYGGGMAIPLSHKITCHGEVPEERLWDYLAFAHGGLALAAGPWPFDNDISKIISYLRGGLPVISEERIVNNRLVLSACYGFVFRYGSAGDLVEKALSLIKEPPRERRNEVMRMMAAEHGWDRRVEAYCALFERLLSERRRPDQSCLLLHIISTRASRLV